MLDMHYEQIGQDNDKSLVILHGFMGSSEDFIKLAQDLSDTFNCYLIDLPGHGKSIDKLKNFPDISSIANNINEWAKTLVNPHLYGYSFGGRIGFAITQTPFSAFMKIIIESANPGIEDKDKKSKRLESDLKLFSDITNDEQFKVFLDNWYKQDLFSNLSQLPNYNNLINRRLKNSNIDSFKKAIELYSIAKQDNYWKSISNPRCSSLYIYGQQDEKYSRIANKINSLGWSVAQINDAGHNAHFSNYNQFIVDLKKFIIS